QLKRAYNRLIRIYKPERSPAEFQRIRAAYEQLDNELRYGRPAAAFSITAAIDPARIWASADAAVTSASGDQAQTGRPNAASLTETLLQRARETDAATLFQELKAEDTKTPVHFYVMALLSDALPGRSPTRFARCLLSGLQAHSNDPGLLSLLYTFYRQPLNPEHAASLLADTAKVITDDRFYSLTEPLWDILIRNRDFVEVLALLEECEQRLRDFRINSKLAFMLHILRAGIWKADAEWVQSTFRFLEENSRLLSPYAEGELDLLTLAWDYRRKCPARPPGPGLKERMYSALESYFVLPEEERDAAFVECQIEIASSVELVQSAFPDYQSEEREPIMGLWLTVAHEVAFRQLGSRPYFRDLDKTMGRRIRAFLATLESTTNRSFRGRLWNFLAVSVATRFAMLVLAALAALLVTVPVHLVFGVDGGLSAAIAVGVAVISLYPIEVFVIRRGWSWYCHRMANRFYRSQWRRAMLQFLADSRLHPRDFHNAALELHQQQMDSATWVLLFMPGDPTVQLYAMAQVYLS
ncbi:MAG: hypothetical protein KDA96_10550, partial [Planctomycetaceae bacterium]|nr:hypothetical protein [Planctomycetaceae bacterium]